MCPFSVRVHTRYCLAVFLGSMVTGAIRPPGGSRYYRVRHSRRICLPRVYLHPSTGCSVSPRPCHCSVPASPVCPVTESLPFLPFGYALRLPLRSRLTLIRLALIRKPWPSGVGVSRPHWAFRRGGFTPPLSLLMPTFAFPDAPERLAPRLRRCPECSPTDGALSAIPRLRYRAYARLLSTPRGSTSELLRTL